MPTKAQRDRYLKKAEEVVRARIAELKVADPTLTEQKIADDLGCSKGTFRNTVYVSQSPVAPKPERLRRLSELLGWAPDALELLQEKGITPELAADDEIPAAPTPKAAPTIRKRAKVVPGEALAPPAPPAPFVKPGSLRRDITKLQEANKDKDLTIHALQREVAELRAMLADVCGQLGIDGPKSRKTA